MLYNCIKFSTIFTPFFFLALPAKTGIGPMTSSSSLSPGGTRPGGRGPGAGLLPQQLGDLDDEDSESDALSLLLPLSDVLLPLLLLLYRRLRFPTSSAILLHEIGLQQSIQVQAITVFGNGYSKAV